MKYRLSYILILLFVFSNVQGQEYFEGQIKYTIEYKSINPNIPTSYLENELGNSFTAYVKEDRYAMIYNANGKQGWMKIIVRLDEGYSYTEFQKSDTIVKSSLKTHDEELLLLKKNLKEKKIVNDVLCESVTLKYKPTDPESYYTSYEGTYYFDPKYKLNHKHYENYTSGFWNLYVDEAKAISLRNETSFLPLFSAIQEAVSIERKEIPSDMFAPNELKIIAKE